MILNYGRGGEISVEEFFSLSLLSSVYLLHFSPSLHSLSKVGYCRQALPWDRANSMG